MRASPRPIEELFSDADDAAVNTVLAYVTLARAVRLGANTDLSLLNPEQRRNHEQALSRCEETYVQARAVYDAFKSQLTADDQQIVERLVEVEFKR